MFIQFLISIAVMLVSTAITMATAQKPEPLKPGTLEVATADEGGSIVVIFGEILIKSPNVIGAMDFSTVPIKAKGGKK